MSVLSSDVVCLTLLWSMTSISDVVCLTLLWSMTSLVDMFSVVSALSSDVVCVALLSLRRGRLLVRTGGAAPPRQRPRAPAPTHQGAQRGHVYVGLCWQRPGRRLRQGMHGYIPDERLGELLLLVLQLQLVRGLLGP